MKNLFNVADVDSTIERINKLGTSSKPIWGKMNVSQMLAHCNVVYEMVFDDIHATPNAFKRILLKLFVKKAVVGAKPYKRNSPTAPQFLITNERNFSKEKKRLIEYLHRTQKLGAPHFNNKENLSFGPLSSREWNIMFSKHIDHHLTQFGV